MARPAQVKWTFFPKLDDDLVTAQTHSPYNRGIALGHGKVFVGTVDGRLIALDMATGKQAWDTKLIDSKKLTVGFTGAPLVVKDKVIIGAQGGEWPWRGPIFGVDANTGEKKWEFFTVAGTEEAKATWGGELLAHRRRRRLDARHLRCADQHGLVGHRQSGTAVRLGRPEMEDRRTASWRQSLHHVGDRARPGHRKAQVLSPGAAA